MLRKFTSAFAMFALTLGLFLSYSDPARAAYADCPDHFVCLWVDGNYSGARYQVSRDTLVDEPDDAVYVGWIDDEASAVYNRTGYPIYVYDSYYCGDHFWYRLIATNQRLTAPGSAINDRITTISLFGHFPESCNDD